MQFSCFFSSPQKAYNLPRFLAMTKIKFDTKSYPLLIKIPVLNHGSKAFQKKSPEIEQNNVFIPMLLSEKQLNSHVPKQLCLRQTRLACKLLS